jgi:hypothetical protein
MFGTEANGANVEAVWLSSDEALCFLCAALVPIRGCFFVAFWLQRHAGPVTFCSYLSLRLGVLAGSSNGSIIIRLKSLSLSL